MHGFLRIFVLRELVKKEKTGYDLMKSFESFTGAKMPSPGTIYPLLNSLLGKGMATVSVENNRKIYRISKKGEKLLHSLMAERKKALGKIISMLSTIYSHKEISRIRKSLNVISGEKEHFVDFDVWNELRDSIVDFATSKEYKKKRHEFREILHSTSEKLKRMTE